MTFFFENFPSVMYDVQKNGKPMTVQNMFLRYKILDVLKNKTALYYTHDVEDGQTPQFIAHRYYGDETLDWVLFIANDIVDTLFDWPLSQEDLMGFIRKKYGSVADAQSETHHYEQIIQSQSVLFDGTIIPEKILEVDSTTYATLAVADRREVSAFDYEVELNDDKRTIKILHKDYLSQFLQEVAEVFD